MKKTAIALMAALTLATPTIAVPQATAAVVTTNEGYRIDQDDTDGAFNGVVVPRKNQVDLRYSHLHSAAGALNTAVQTDVFVDGNLIHMNPVNTQTTSRTEGGADVVETVTREAGVTTTRTVTVQGRSAKVDVDVQAGPQQRVQLYITTRQLDGSGGSLAKQFTGAYENGVYNLQQDGRGYSVTVAHSENVLGSAAQGGINALNAMMQPANPPKGAVGLHAGVQMGRWSDRETPGQISGSVTVDVISQPDAVDTDGDGIPDKWEEDGVHLPSGAFIDLPRMGADPRRPDLFLQLNWMPSMWEARGCGRTRPYGASDTEALALAKCADLQKNVHRPSREMLRELEELFDANGINLHIDAGPVYSTQGIEPADWRGGQTSKLPYRTYSSDGDNVAMLQKFHTELLGERDAVWHVGVLGDRISQEKMGVSGVAVKGESFFVAKGACTATEIDKVNAGNLELCGGLGDAAFRGTILHEFAHVLGLHHDGGDSAERDVWNNILKHEPHPKEKERNYVADYKSAMNYLYQHSGKHFQLTTGQTRAAGKQPGDARPYFGPCPDGVKGDRCFLGQSNIAPDWDELQLATQYIGKLPGVAPATEESPQHFEEKITAHELAILAALENNYTAHISDDSTVGDGNALVTKAKQNVLHMKVQNLGIDPHTFTVKARWGAGQETEEEVSLPGIASEGSMRTVAFTLTDMRGVAGPNEPVEFRVFNEKGVLVSDQTFQIPVLDYTPEQAAAVRAQLTKSNADPKLKQAALNRLDAVGTPVAGPTATATVSAPRNQKPIERPAPKPTVTETKGAASPAEPSNTGNTSGSSVDGGVIAGIVLALLGAVAAGVGWWYSNGGQLPPLPELPF